MNDYIILGGGIGGIISVSVIYHKYPDAKILWIDNNGFTSGDLIKYPQVPANTPFKVLVYFIEKIYELLGFNRSISEVCNLINKTIFKLDCLSKELQIITTFIKTLDRITLQEDHIEKLLHKDGAWNLNGKENNYIGKKVVLCTGSEHKKLNYNIPEIPIKTALNPFALKELNIKSKHIIVFGNSHSGILILKNLYDIGCNKITNVIKEPVRIPYFNNDNVEVYQESGIRGIGLKWAKENIVPENKTNIIIHNFKDLKTVDADYVIYSIGLKPRNIDILYNGVSIKPNPNFNETGLIAPDLYGLGVAYPRFYLLNGDTEYEIGMGGFLQRALCIF